MTLAGWAIAAWWLQRLIPVRLPEVAGLELLAKLLVVVGMTSVLAAMIELRRHGTSPDPGSPASTLVTSGPFRLSRNPIYLGLLVLVAGLGVEWGNPWALALVPVAAVALHRLTVVREEREMRREFGDDYDRYRSRVRRWL